MSSPSSKSPEQTDKSKKYDRQIRLWGENGQSLLENSAICVVNATAVGCEVLKSLVLPGISQFTITDGSVVTEDDLGINFFVDAAYVGHSKAEICTQLLEELNSDVTGDFLDESIEYVLCNRPSFFRIFDLVIASNLSEQTLLQLSNCLWEENIPFIYCRSLGFVGTVRLQIKEHCIIETHPDNRQFDLRLDNPFPALTKHFESITTTNKVPWLVILNKYLQLWKSQNNDRIPGTYREKSQLRDMIREGMTADEDNYEEAIKAVNTVFGGGTITSNLKTVFDDDACSNLSKMSNPFWIMAKALKEFVLNDNNGFLPLPGVLPDMTADTESYINLQNVYRQQALLDADAVYRKCQKYLKEFCLPEDTITEKMVRLFCREAAGLTVVRGTKIADEYEKTSQMLSIVDELELQGSLTELYLVMRAYERFLTECGHIPGECYVENDISRLKTIASKVLSDIGIHSAAISDDIIHEICRYGGAEVHTISALIGGCVAQEAIKIITKQYKPIDNTFIYNGITSKTVTWRL